MKPRAMQNLKVIGTAEPEVTREQAEAAADLVGVTVESLRRVANKTVLGKFYAHGRHGFIIAETQADREALQAVQDVVKGIVVGGAKTEPDEKEGDAAIRLQAADVFTKIIGKKVELAELELKAAEISGYSQQKAKGQNIGPVIDA